MHLQVIGSCRQQSKQKIQLSCDSHHKEVKTPLRVLTSESDSINFPLINYSSESSALSHNTLLLTHNKLRVLLTTLKRLVALNMMTDQL
jgi:hypothetical protein